MAQPALIAFGAIAPWPPLDQLDELRNALQQHECLNPLVKSIQELPLLWEQLASNDSGLHSTVGKAAAEQMAHWISKAANIDAQSNITRMPLTVISHIAQYITYLHHFDEPLRHKSVIDAVMVGGGIQGFCIGLLSALAVASGKTEDDVGSNAATSVQLAFCIGAYVDLNQQRNAGDSEAFTLALRWRPSTKLDEVERLLSRYHNTRIAVVRDIRDITITARADIMDDLLQDLSRLGVSVRDTGVSGLYHAAVHEGTSDLILRACTNHFVPTLYGSDIVRSNTTSHPFPSGDVTLMSLKCILEERADWYSTMSSAASKLEHVASNPFILSIGVDAVPQSISKTFHVVKTSLTTDRGDRLVRRETILPPGPNPTIPKDYPHDAIAIIGMACRFPGAESTDKFWELLIEGRSMLSEVPLSRFGPARSTRSSNNVKFWGNFLNDIESFDHGFFKKSPREAQSMDPQQRLLLEIAYESLESSGYFADTSRRKDVGCYIGACAADYDFNVASHPANAYSATGTLRSFLSGKLSHYFGWSGPSLVLDTACSSSAVAIHTACAALRTEQCSQALAGGITMITSPYLFENFAAARFLSPTGACKPFSADADGYCRGEGGGLVVLKRLSDAIRDADHVLGVIAGSAVNQNENCVPITVPHTPSQSELYERVTRQAGVSPSEITFVEAHGTGTPVGDPIEMDSIRRVFGGPSRGASLVVSSAKGNIGHLEGGSGVVALIKSILQIENRLAPKQASFTSLNPKIPALELDNICIPTSNRTLTGKRLAACVNNYGAAGSNAAMIVLQAPERKLAAQPTLDRGHDLATKKFPIQLAAASKASLLGYCRALDDYCRHLLQSRNLSEHPMMFSDMAYGLSRRLNQELPFSITFNVGDMNQLRDLLRQQDAQSNAVKQRSKSLPLVLCFGGQVSDRVALNKSLWQDSLLLRFHLDSCDRELRALNYPGIYPWIFDNQPVNDVTVLHSVIFSMQYSCAQAWLESGLRVDVVIGHSFGQLTSLCVAKVLSLRDALRLVAGRASLMKRHWGPEAGTMIAVETDQYTLRGLQEDIRASQSTCNFEFACYNGPTSCVVVSDNISADELEAKLVERTIRHKRLNVPYGFHSRFTEPLLRPLEELALTLTFQKPDILVETCTAAESWQEASAKLIALHTREPVYFDQAVQRLQSRMGPCTWVEAGSDSGIISMVRRVLGQSSAASNNLVPLQLNKPSSSEMVVDSVVALWNAGHRLQYWNFHKIQAYQYDNLRLPHYAWEKSKHWMDLNMSPATISSNKSDMSSSIEQAPKALPPTLLRLESSDSSGHHFVISPSSDEYQTLVADVRSMDKATCPIAFYVELACRAVKFIENSKTFDLLSLRDFYVNQNLQLDLHQSLKLDLILYEQGWKFRYINSGSMAHVTEPERTFCRAEGLIGLTPTTSDLDEVFRRYERLTNYCKLDTIADDVLSDSLRGKVVYNVLAHVASYPNWYHGVKSVTSVDSCAIAQISRPSGIPKNIYEATVTSLPLLESFFQVPILHANCLRGCSGGELFRFSKAEHLQYGPGFEAGGREQSSQSSWRLTAYCSTVAGDPIYDIFVYDTFTTKLALFMIGVHFQHQEYPTTLPKTDVSIAGVQDCSMMMDSNKCKSQINPLASMEAVPIVDASQSSKPHKSVSTSIYEDICRLLEQLADIPRDQASGQASFDDLGVDSLMMIEVIGELSALFRVDLPVQELEELTDINSLVEYLREKGCVGTTFDGGDDSTSQSSSQIISSSPENQPNSSNTSVLTTPPEHMDYGESGAASSRSDEPTRRFLPTSQYVMQDTFERLRFDFEVYAKRTGATGYWKTLYPRQAELVCTFVVDAYRKLGCDLTSLAAGQQVPSITALPKHNQLVAQLRRILLDSGVVEFQENQTLSRTAKVINSVPSGTQYKQLLQEQPVHSTETELLNVIGPHLADCLIGRKDPLSLLFGDKTNRELLADFYADSPMCKAAIQHLAEFVKAASSSSQFDGVFSILEVGAGTGGTTKHLVEYLIECGAKFEYTFTDISQSLVSQARRKFSKYSQMKFMKFDCDQPAPEELLRKSHVVVSTNCIHATSDISRSAANILPTLRDDGVLCLVEYTRNIYWFDLVFGLLEGWWAFIDGRQHALANECFWDKSLRAAGFNHVSWTDGNTEEAKTIRIICAFKSEARGLSTSALPTGKLTKRSGQPMEEIVWKRVGSLDISADVYLPKTPDPPGKKRAIALLIHGGGHFMFGRKDVPMKHVRTLLDRGFLPISTDYRLCPETTLFEGPMTDCCDALQWATETLPTLYLLGPHVTPDPTKVVSVGWSSGGQLAMSLSFMAQARGIKIPDAILGMYPPTDMECDHWRRPCYPLAAEEDPTEIKNILAGVQESPIIEYTPYTVKKTLNLSLTLKDDRARMILHTCWNSQTLPILVHGLPHKNCVSPEDKTDWRYPPPASTEQIQAISALWQIRQGNYKTPTFICHGDSDDWLPLSMNERTIAELKRRGIPAGLAIAKQCRHGFDLFPVGDPLGVGWTSVEKGIEFLCNQLGMDR